MSQHDGGSSLQHIAALMGLPGLSLQTTGNIPVNLQVNTDVHTPVSQLSLQQNHASPNPTPPLQSPGPHTPMNLHQHQQQNPALHIPQTTLSMHPPNSTLTSPMVSPMSMVSRSPIPIGSIPSPSQHTHIPTSMSASVCNQAHQVHNLQAYMMNTAPMM